MRSRTTAPVAPAPLPEVSEAPLLLSVPQAARLLGVGTTFGWELVHAGTLPSIRLGRRVLIPRAALEQFIATTQSTRSTA